MSKDKFEWADEYFAVSISESQLDKVREYIKNQEEHHQKKPGKKNIRNSYGIISFRMCWAKAQPLVIGNSTA
jgi:hypothetical protein